MIQSDELHLNSKECERFSELMERKWVDEHKWTEEDNAFFTYHKNTCLECSNFDELLSVFNNFSEINEEVSDEIIQESVRRRFAAVRHRRYLSIGIAATLLIGAAFVLIFALSNRSISPDAKMFELAKGSLILEGHPIDIGEQFIFEKKTAEIPMDTLIEIPGTLYIAMEKNAKIGSAEQEGDTVHLILNQGRIAVHLIQGSRTGVEVELKKGTVKVKGTVFIVKADRDADVVQVIRGSVSVKPKAFGKDKSQTLDAGWAFSFGNQKQSPRETLAKDHLLDLLGISESLTEASIETPRAPDNTKAAQEMVASEENRPMNAEHPSPEFLLQAALECRTAKNWKCAVENYRKVVDFYPALPDAATAMIPMAQILLENLKRPKEALQYFIRYQKKRPQGGLGQEALYGECSAFEQMGREKAEKDCLERYLEKYPNTLYTQMAKSRLMSIMVKD